MKIKCPNCGNKGSTHYDSDAFEVRGIFERKPVRKCLRCGAGLFVLPPKRIKLIDVDLWAPMQESWAREFGTENMHAKEQVAYDDVELCRKRLADAADGYVTSWPEGSPSALDEAEDDYISALDWDVPVWVVDRDHHEISATLHQLLTHNDVDGALGYVPSVFECGSFEELTALGVRSLAHVPEALGPEADEASSYPDYPEIECPTCGNAGSSAPGSPAFEYRVVLGEPKVRMCRRCGRGLWLHLETGETESMSDESWAGIEMMHATLGGGASVDAEWARREAESREGSDDDRLGPGEEASFQAHADPDGDVHGALNDQRALYRAIDALQIDDWPIQGIAAHLFFCQFKGENGSWRFYVQGEDESERIVFYSALDTNVPESHIPDLAELITRINFGLWIGNFEIDLSDGELRFKTSIDVRDDLDALTREVVERLAYTNVTTFDAYYPALMAVLHGGRSPSEALDLLPG
jgi:hypothetical protein